MDDNMSILKMNKKTFSTDSFTLTVAEVLKSAEEEISWAKEATVIFEAIERTYALISNCVEVARCVIDYASKIKELEHHITLDFQLQVVLNICRAPFFLNRISALLGQGISKIETDVTSQMDGKVIEDTPRVRKHFVYLVAEIQAAFGEFGFCENVDALPQLDEASRRLDALDLRLDKVKSKVNEGVDVHASIVREIHGVLAAQEGVKQALTHDSFSKIRPKYESINSKLLQLENNIGVVAKDSESFLQYTQREKVLSNGVLLSNVAPNSCQEILDSNNIHPGTRHWFMERLSRWLETSNSHFYYVAAKCGYGKTAMAAAVCKLLQPVVVAAFFLSAGDTLSELIFSLSRDLCRSISGYLEELEARNINLSDFESADWVVMYRSLLREPLCALFGPARKSARAPVSKASARRRLVVIDGLELCAHTKDLKEMLKLISDDISPTFCVLVTTGAQPMDKVLQLGDSVEGCSLEQRAWQNLHIRDVEVYLSSSLGAILSGEDDTEAPNHVKADEMTLQNTVDEMLKCSGGRFDFAHEIIECFAEDFRKSSGQFLGSVKKSSNPLRRKHEKFQEFVTDFASPFRAYRDKEGRSVTVRILRQSQYLMDKTRVALIRGRQRPDSARSGGVDKG